jgi:hypothetical protein
MDIHEFKAEEPLKTPCCYNCFHMDLNDIHKDLAIPKCKCTLLNVYKYRYGRCNEHKEKVKGTVILKEQVIILNPKGGINE